MFAKEAAFTGDWRKAQSHVGLFCEAASRICRHVVTGYFTPLGDDSFKVENETNKTTAVPKTDERLESLRLLVPQAIKLAYSFRNKRGVDHLSLLTPNYIDATLDLSLADWILAELVRVAATSHDAARMQVLIDALVERQAPILEKIGNDWRVLHSMPLDEMILLVKYYDDDVTQAELVKICRASQPTVSRAITRLDNEVYLHKNERQITITRKGRARVEARLHDSASALARGA